ncbi:MAG TPA: hypothetical protein VGM07_02395 [Stellaceae bacterium]|jgi:hypothetical protein
MAMIEDLGKLICDMNPYTEMPKWQMSGAVSTGVMDPYVLNPAPTVPVPTGTTAQFVLEREGRYPAQWNFKGQPYNVNTAVKLCYRFPVLGKPVNPDDPPPVLYWVTEYLLIGYLGANGG